MDAAFWDTRHTSVSAKLVPLQVELLALKEVQLGSNTNISHVQNERLIMQAVPPHQFVVGMLYAFRTPR